MDRPAELREVLLAFLRAEADSPTEAERARAALDDAGKDEGWLGRDDVPSDAVFELFMLYRGGESLFDGLNLQALNWREISLSLKDLQQRVVTCRNTFEARYDSRCPVQIAREWDAAGKHNGVMEKVKRGMTLERPILVGDESRLVILEGHNRLISYLREPESAPFPVPAFVGSGTDLSAWGQW